MKNSYLVVGALIVVAIAVFVFSSKKSEAPVALETAAENKSVSEFVFEKGNYKLNTEKSFITWQGENLTGSSHEGTLKVQSGSLSVSENGDFSGDFVIDMNTINTEPKNERLLGHLKSDDFFAVASHPTATFVLKKVMPATEESAKIGRYVFAGDLTIKGITKPISFIATLGKEAGTVTAKASFAINRADWEIKYNSPTFFSNLGDKIIRDAVVIGLDLKAEKVIQ